MPDIRRLAEKQLKRHDLDERLLEKFRVAEGAAHADVPVITISREMGSGGKTIGQMLAARAGFACYDREILDAVARETESSPEHIGRVEQASHDALMGMMLNMLDRRHVPDTVYMRALVRIMRQVAGEGRVVIIGRGGACILRKALKVRVVAPLELRVQRMADVEHLSPRDAEHRVLSYDYQQRRFLRNLFHCTPDDVLLFDLIINTEAMALEHAVDLITTQARNLWPEGMP